MYVMLKLLSSNDNLLRNCLFLILLLYDIVKSFVRAGERIKGHRKKLRKNIKEKTGTGSWIF